MDEVDQTFETDANRRTMRSRLVLLSIGAAILVCAWIIVSAPRASHDGYSRLRVGMTRSEVYSVLGESHYESAVVGYVDGGSLTTNDASNRRTLLKKGYSDFIYEAWWSPKLSVNVAFDREGRVACFYSGDGQKRTLLGILWPKKRAVLPPPLTGAPN